MKLCSHCKIASPLSDFYPRKSTTDGLDYQCKDCHRQYRRQNKDRNNAAIAAWAKKNPERGRARVAKWRQTTQGREYVAHSTFMKRFSQHGLTLDQYHALVEQQNFQCA